MTASRIFAGTSRSTMTESDCARISMGRTESDKNAAANANDIENGNLRLLDILPPCAHRKLRNSRRQPRTIAIAGRTQIQCLAPAPDQTFKQEKENQMRKAGIVGFASVLAFAACMFFYIKKTHAAGAAAPGSGYKVSGQIPVAGAGGWDYLVIDAAEGKVLGTFAVGGKPEFAAADGKGSVYANVEDTSELLHIDAQKMTVLHRWPLAPCKEPSGLAMDTKTRRLFAVCDNEMMAVVDADSGKVIATPKTGEGADAAAFDPGTNLAFSSNGESGTLTVVHEDAPDKYSVVENVPTKKSARTMALDLKMHTLYLPSADLIPPAAGQKRPSVKPGTMELLIVSK